MSEQQMDQNEAVPLLPVHIAVMKDNVALLQKLIQSGATQLDQKTYETALHVAARAPSLQCLRWLLDNNINSARDRDCKGSTPCHYAVVYSNLEALEILLNHNPKEKKELSEIKDDNGLTIMGLATLQNDLQMVQWTVERFPGLAHIRDNRGNLPIHLAAAGGSLGIVKLLVNRYGSKYAEESGTEKKFQPLYYAVDKGHIDIVKYLIDEVKVDPLAKAQGGMTTLHAAVTAHQVQITEWLVEKLGPGRILERSDDGATLLHLAAAEGLADLLQFLIDHLQDKSSINVKDDLASTPAHDAAEFGEHSTLLVLLKNGADITMLNQNTETPFDLAVQNSHNDLIAMMNDFREHGLKGLAKYGAQVSGEQVPPEPAPNEPVPNEQVSVEVEVTMQSSSSGLEKSTGSVEPVRTSKVEALEITNLINEATDISEKRKEEKLTRHKSLQELILTDDNNNDSGEEIELQLMKNKENSQANTSKTNDTEEVDVVIPHEISPEGEIYAKVNKPKKKKNTRRKDEQTDDVVSSHVSSPKSQVSSNRVARLNNAMNKPYKKTSVHRMSENESVSSLSTSVSHSKRIDQLHAMNPYGYYPVPPQYLYNKGPHSVISTSSIGSGSAANHYPPSLPGYLPGQYPYMPAMVAQYYGYPYPPQGVYPLPPRAKGINERIHMEALQKSGGQPFAFPQYMKYPPHKKHGHPSSVQSDRKKKQSTKNHTERTIGFGPSNTDDMAVVETDIDHPAPPPITKGGKLDHNPTELMHANFIMVKADTEGKVPAQATGGTKLHRARIPKKYDGRYDDYIETDSEDERTIPEHVNISTLAESALVLLMAPLLGLKGIEKRRPKQQMFPPKMFDEIEAAKTSKHWSSRDDTKQTSSQATNKPDDWSKMLGIPLTTPSISQDISGSIRARNFGFQEIKMPSLHESMASLHNNDDADDDDDDDIISVVIGLEDDLEENLSKAVNEESENSTPKNKKHGKKKTAGETSNSDKLKKKSNKKQGKILKDESSKKSTPNSRDEGRKKKTKKPAENIDDDQEKLLVTAPSQESLTVKVEEMFAETVKEMDLMLAKMPKTPSVLSIDESTENLSSHIATEQEHQQLAELQTMFQQSPPTNNTDDVSEILEALNLRSEDASPQQEKRIQLIKNVLAGKDPELVAQLQSLVSAGWSPLGGDADHLQSGSSTQLIADIENKLLEIHERQKQQTQEQAKFSEALEKRLEEQATRQMESMKQQLDQQLDQQRKLLMEQLEEQRKLLEKERRGVRPRHKVISDTETDDDELMVAQPISHMQVGRINQPIVKVDRMQAVIQHQLPLKWEDYAQSNDDNRIPEPPPLPTIAYLMDTVNNSKKPVKKKLDKRRRTEVDFEKTSKALESLQFVNNYTYSEESDDDMEGDELVVAKAKIATRKRADIMKNQREQINNVFPERNGLAAM